ncbi:hypothetical protein [Salegentibacter sp. F14]
MAVKFTISGMISWIFTVVFVILGILNLILIHPVPGIFYILFSCIFPPGLNSLLKEKTGLIIPFWIKLLLGLIILWGTLAVGDLAEMYGW